MRFTDHHIYLPTYYRVSLLHVLLIMPSKRRIFYIRLSELRRCDYVIENKFDSVTDLTAYLSDWFVGTGRIYPFEY